MSLICLKLFNFIRKFAEEYNLILAKNAKLRYKYKLEYIYTISQYILYVNFMRTL